MGEDQMQPIPGTDGKISDAPIFQNTTRGDCEKCGQEGRGDYYETIYGRKSYVRASGYIGMAYDSFVTKKVFICDQCIAKTYHAGLTPSLILFVGLVVATSGLCLWPGMINISGKDWGIGVAFLLAALIPGILFCIFYIPDFRGKQKYMRGIPQSGLSQNQIEKMKGGIRLQGERLAKKMVEVEFTSSQDPTLQDYNLFLTPSEYKVLLAKSTTQIDPRK
jgi:hypothetical protein